MQVVEWANQNFLGHGPGRISALEKKTYWKYVVVMDSKSWHCLTWNSWSGFHRNLLPHISTSAEANPLPTFAFKIFNHYAYFQCKKITTKTNHDLYSHMFFFLFCFLSSAGEAAAWLYIHHSVYFVFGFNIILTFSAPYLTN